MEGEEKGGGGGEKRGKGRRRWGEIKKEGGGGGGGRKARKREERKSIYLTCKHHLSSKGKDCIYMYILYVLGLVFYMHVHVPVHVAC